MDDVPSHTVATNNTPDFAVGGWRRWQRWLVPGAGLGVFVAAVVALHHFLGAITYADLARELLAVSHAQLVAAVALAAASFIALTGYDWSALRYIGRRLPYRRVAQASFCGYAISNTVGLTFLSGGSVRYRVYLAAGLDGADVAKVTFFTMIALAAGVHVVGAVALTLHPELVAGLFHVPAEALRLIGWGALILLVLALAVMFTRRTPVSLGRWRIALPEGRIAVAQVLISVTDIVCAGACLYVLLPAPEVPFLAFLVVYALAVMAGASSHVPGGLGVFEAVILLALSDHVAAQSLTAALVMYRVIYHLLPLGLAIALLVVHELRRRPKGIPAVVRRVRDWGAKIVPFALSGFAFLSGAVLLASAATPSLSDRLQVLEDFVPLSLVEASNLLSSVAGLGLLIVARGLYRKLNGAYVMALALSLSGAAFSLIKGIDYEEGIILLVMAALLHVFRREFYRQTRLLDSPFSLGSFTAIVGALSGMYAVLLFAYKDVSYAHDLWWQFEFGNEVSRSMRAVLAAAVSLLLFGLMRLLRPPRRMPGLPDAAALQQADAIVVKQDNANANLVRAGDKHILLADTQDAFLMYGVRGASWISLGDPVGPADVADELAWRFRERVDREGGRIAFYHTRPETLPLYIDMGLTPVKLGEEAVVKLDGFTLDGPARKHLRYARSRGERDGLRMEMIPAVAVGDLITQLAAVSDAWLSLKNTREKRFSVGAFSDRYIAQFPVAVVWHAQRIVAFASLMTTQTKAEASVDLMRHVPDCPSSTMLYLFIELLLHFKAQGYRRFALGMAPLSGMETHPLAPLWHRFGYVIFNRGERFYNFQGLRQFKEKFLPDWEPRYLATESGISPLLVLTDIAALIGGGTKGVFSK